MSEITLRSSVFDFNSLSAQCHLLITFANSLDPDQERQNARQAFKPALDNFLEGKGAMNDTWKKRHPGKKQETNALQQRYKNLCAISVCFALAFKYIWASTQENLSSPFANNKGADQPAHLHRLISTFVFRLLQSIISRLAMR